MKITKLMLALALSVFASAASAQLAGKNVLLVQGFLPQHILLNPSDEGQSDGISYWDNFDSGLNNNSTSEILYWPSHYPVQGPNGIAALLADQLTPILSSGHCDNECIIITHSTGDLVMRYFLANKQSLLGSSLANRLKVAAVIDMAGAGGGTELADLAVDVINGVNVGGDIIEALLEWAGFDLEIGINPGVLVDLQPSVARNTATSGIPAIPRLRIAGTGDELYGFLTHPLIKGGDDSVVPLHSACGASSNSSYDSCVRDLRMNGKVKSVSKAPYSSQLYNYHYPVILSETVAHNEMQDDKTGNEMTFALSAANNYNNSSAKTINLDVEYYEYLAWWDWWNRYRVITNSDNKTVGRVILDSFE